MAKPTGRQIAAARTILGISQADLAARASVSVPTIKRMEASAGIATGMANNVAAVCRALEAAGVVFIAENGGGAGVRLRKGSVETMTLSDDEMSLLKSAPDELTELRLKDDLQFRVRRLEAMKLVKTELRPIQPNPNGTANMTAFMWRITPTGRKAVGRG